MSSLARTETPGPGFPKRGAPRRDAPRRDASGARARRLAAWGIATALLVLALDQASKWWVLHVLDLPARGSVRLLPVLNFTMEWNRGVVFGLLNGLGGGGGGAIVLAIGALAVVAMLGVWLARAERPMVALAIGAIAGGAIGNVVDRIHYGAVVDFIHAHAFGYSWYIFNVADSAIFCGVVALVLDGLLPPRGESLAPGDGVG